MPSPEPLPEPPSAFTPLAPFPLFFTSLSFTVFEVVVGAVLIELEEELPIKVKEFPERFKTPVIGEVMLAPLPIPFPIP
ncbi:Uncharacterised protein [Acinetobacter baumannii]|nr:Uncharacterised protein [Acinetobacter baumannii]